MILSESPRIEFINDDCMNLLKSYADKQFDLAIVDPPYGIGMDNSNKRTKPDRPNSYTSLYADFRYHKSDWDNEMPSEMYFKHLRRASKNQIIWGANYFCEDMRGSYGWIFWNKKNGLDNCFSDGEFAFQSMGIQSRYFECSPFDGLRGGKDRIHPTQKPVALYKWLLKNYAKTGDKILDTHGGSFSSAIACHQMGFDFVGIERDEDYFNAAVKRFKQYQSQGVLF